MAGEKIRLFLQLSRVPFLSVGVLPLLLGFVLAQNAGHPVHWPVAVLALLAVTCIMLATYYHGEAEDFDTDSINVEFNRFSGGSRMVATGVFSARFALGLSYVSIALAVLLGLIIQFVFHTGALTLFLGGFGLGTGVFYSGRPIQLARRGLGEIFIGFCYGWLTVNTGYYLMSQRFAEDPTLVSLPIALSIFLVIFINEFPDYHSDRQVQKNNLVVRLGHGPASWLYMGVMGLNLAVLAALAWHYRVHSLGWALLAVPMSLGIVNLEAMLRGKHREHRPLEALCGRTIFFNLSITGAFILIFLCRWTG